MAAGGSDGKSKGGGGGDCTAMMATSAIGR
jgi:hypothetical protein